MGSILVPYAELQQAVDKNPSAVEETVHQSAAAAAGGDPVERDRLIKKWHDAMASLESAKNADDPTALSTPQHGLASRLQTLLATRSADQGQLETVQPRTVVTTDAGDSEAPAIVQVKFDSNDLLGWLGTGLTIIFKSNKHPWVTPLPVPEPLADDAKIAVFGDWATGLYGAPIITK